MAYNTQYGYNDEFDYSKELLRTDISDAYRKTLEKERQNKIDHLYGGKEPTLEGSNLTYTQKYGTNNNGNQFTSVKTVTNASTPYQIVTLPNNLEVSGDVKYEYVGQANQYLQSALSKIQSGKTSYSDDARAMIEKIQNREAFSYDLDTDPLFQQALASAMGSGKQAMQDTIGQASALTGGYGSTYATSAGNQSYNAFIEDAYNNFPQYYQMAYDAYQADTQDMYQQLGMLSDADAREYQRLIDAYSVAYDADNIAYNRYRDTVNDAWREKEFNYNAEQDAKADAQWQQSFDYGKEQDAKADAQWQQSFDYGKEQDAKAYEQWQQSFDYEKEQDAKAYEQWQQSFDYEKEQDAKEDSRYLAENDWNKDGKVDTKDQIYYNKYYGNTDKETEKKVPSKTLKEGALEAFNKGGYEAYSVYMESLPSNVDTQEIIDFVEKNGDDKWDFYDQEFTKVEDTYNNLWGWITQKAPSDDEDDIDWNDKVSYTMNGVTVTKTIKEVKKELEKLGFTDEQIEKKLMELTSLRKEG